jgi:hypothetical protein
MEFDLEAWSAHPPGFERLLARLASYGRVLALSGDVHFGASADLTYWARKSPIGLPLRLPVDDNDPALTLWREGLEASRLVQFTSSAAKNQVPEAKTLLLFARTTFAQRAQRLASPLERLGWKDSASEPVQLSDISRTRPAFRARLALSPVLLPAGGWPEGTGFLPFEWAWRVQLLQDRRPDLQRPPEVRPLPTELPDPLTPENAFEAYRLVARRHRDSLDKALFARQMVFATNLGRVRFDTAAGPISAIHELLAVHPEDEFERPATYTQYTVSLEPDAGDPPPMPRTDGG